jgi:hypothetical protein
MFCINGKMFSDLVEYRRYLEDKKRTHDKLKHDTGIQQLRKIMGMSDGKQDNT